MKNDIEYFATTADVSTRLSNGLIKYKGQWMYSLGSHGWVIQLRGLTENSKEIMVDVQKEIHNIELGRPRLGFFNLGANAFWPTVMPARQYTQVLMPRSVMLDPIAQGVNKASLNAWRTSQYQESLNHRYPSVREIEEKLERGDITSAAFSRNFALSQYHTKGGKKTRTLFHRNATIGHYDFEGKRYHIQPSFDTPLLTQVLTKNEINYIVD